MILLELFLTFFMIGAVTVGGGYAMLPLMQEQVALHWGDILSQDTITNFIAVSESTPGPFAVNMATYVGSEVAGVLGSVCATLGVVLPSFIIILLIAAVLLYWILTSVEAEKAFKIFGVVYIGAVVLMTAVSVGVYVTRRTPGALLYMIGAVLFTASDIILIFNTFTKDGKAWMRPTNLILYYLGQLFIALSIQTM